MTASGFRRYSALVLWAVIAVILWGAYVRATGSGAGCGSHWPTCNGEIIPRAPSTATIIEFTHRATSGVSFLMVVAQLVWALRAFPRGHAARRGATWSMIFMVTEALVGAGLVLFEMVAGNKSVARGAWMIAHLGNTFALLASLVLTWAAAAPPRLAGAFRPRTTALLAGGAVALVLVGASGAIAALGDTLFPASSLAAGWEADFSSAAHLFVRLRVLHPVLAIATGVLLLASAGVVTGQQNPPATRRLAVTVVVLVLAQIAAGFLNLVLLAPIAMQLVHLLLADLLWLAVVLLTAAHLRLARAARGLGPAPAEVASV